MAANPVLRRFQRELALFAGELATPLGTMLRRLMPVFAGGRQAAPELGEPDGFDGITRRGPFERLLHSEWALRETAPLEFLRRAVDAEQSFYKLANRAESAKKGTVALFCSGPEQLGNARIVQLAVLLILSERARSEGSAFGWQLMERPGEPLLGTVDAESVRSFLGGRSALDTSEQTVAEWRRELAGRELWLVGPRRLVPDDHRPYVVVRELLAPGSSGVSVQVRMSSVPERSVHLPMPEDDLAARLLRNPFDVPTQLTPPLISNVLLTPSGSRTFFKTSANALVSFGTPSSPQAVRELADPVSRKRRAFLAKEGLTIVAAGVRGQRSAWLAIGSGVAVLEATEPLRRGAGRVLTCPLPSGPPPERLWPLVISTSPLAALYVGGDGSLWRLRFDGQRAELLAEGTETLVRTDLERAIASVRGYRGRPALIQISPGWVTELPQSYAGRGSFIHHSQRNGVETVIHASEHADGGWLLDRHARRAGHEERSHLELRPGADKRVVGVFDAQARLDSMGLCVLGGDARWLYLIETTRLALTLCTTSQPIVEVAVATSGTRIAYRTSQGVLGFVDGARRVRVPLEQTL